jgi:hypothetical protein
MIGDAVAVRPVEFWMKPRLSIAPVAALIALWLAAPTPSDGGSCRHNGSHNCFKLPATLDFSSVPDISDAIVVAEPKVRSPAKPAIEPQPASQPYTGPMLGVSSHVGAPTVGYYWSIQ